MARQKQLREERFYFGSGVKKRDSASWQERQAERSIECLVISESGRREANAGACWISPFYSV